MLRQKYKFLRYFFYICAMKVICIILGSLSLGLGIAGIFLPLLPTTPFLLLTAALYFRGSPRLYDWLLRQKRLGPYIRNFREHKAIPLHAKITSRHHPSAQRKPPKPAGHRRACPPNAGRNLAR